MAYDNNEPEYENAAPKKADVLIKSTQTIVNRQEEQIEQTKIAISRIDEAIELCNKNSQEASYILDHSTEMFEKLQAENSALKQELLYLAKQSENIYAGLAEKLNELQSEGVVQPQPGEAMPDANYYELADRISEVHDRLNEMSARIDALSAEKTEGDLNEKFAILYDKIDSVSVEAAKAQPVVQTVQSGLSESDGAAILDKLERIMDTVRKNEGAHSMLADKFEILSMRVEQFGFESAKPQVYSQPAMYPVPTPAPVQTAEIDYDKLASKVAEILSVRESISPDLIASKVAEQIVMPESGSVEIDTRGIAEEVASLIDVKSAIMQAEAEKSAPVEIDGDAIADKLAERVNGILAENKNEPLDEEGLADRIAERLTAVTSEAAPAVAPVEFNEDTLADKIAERLSAVADGETPAPVEINEDSLADKIAERLNVVTDEVATDTVDTVEFDDEALVEKIVSRLSGIIGEASPAHAQIDIDQEDLADAIALKVGSLKPEDFEILVDDAGCASISREIAEKLDYHSISTVIADKLRDILELNAANAPDYEDMAERISEKITVAGINEDAIADKAAAVLSNYLPEFDTEEIADKVTGAVIDVVSAMPQPTIDSEAICNEISERLIERQEDNNYDIVIDDDGISRITAIVAEELEKDTDARFDKLEESIAKITEMLAPVEEELEEGEEVGGEEQVYDDEVSEEEIATLSETIATEIEKGTASRFDKVEEDIAKIYELVSNIVVDDGEEQFIEEGEEVYDDADYSSLSEIVAAEIEKGVTSRLDSVEEKLDSLAEMFTTEEVVEEEAAEEGEAEEEAYAEDEAEEEYSEEDYQRLSEIVAQMESNLSSRFDSVEEKLDSLTGLMTEEEVEDGEEEYEEEYAEGEEDAEVADDTVEEDGYTKLSEIVSARFDSVEEKINSLTELISGEEYEGEEEYDEAEEEEYPNLSEIVATEIEKGVSARFDSVEEKINSLTELVSGTAGGEEYGEATEEDYTKLSQIVATEIEKGVTARFDSVEDNIRRINAIVGGIAVAGVATNGENRSAETDFRLYEQFDKVAYDIKKISEYVTGEIPVVANERVDKIAAEISRISQLIEGEISVETHARLDKLQEEIENLTVMLGGTVDKEDSERLERVEGGVDEIKGMLIGGAVISSADETAAAQTAEVEEEEEQELVTVSDLVKPVDLGNFGEEEDDDFLLSALDMDKFSDDEHMPGELGDFESGVDFENMMKYNRSFIARIIQSDDDCKQYYGAVKHALLSYKKVNSNVAWGNERFNKGRETVARMKIRGKTLVVYLALDPNEYKTSVYHHADVSDNKSVLGTPMMIKVKSPLGVRKAIRLIDEMLAKRDGEKREIPERDYAAMYPYETIEELIEDGLVKDVRKK